LPFFIVRPQRTTSSRSGGPPRNEKLFTRFSKAGSNVIESAAMLMEFAAAPHERQAKLAKRLHETEHAGTTHSSRWSRAPLQRTGPRRTRPMGVG
jgi:hypothetical protein